MSDYWNAAKYITLPVKLVDGSGNCSRTTPSTTISYPDDHTATGRHGRADVQSASDGTIIEEPAQDDTLPNGHRTITRRYVSPFAAANRKADYCTAWASFSANAKPEG